MKQTERVLTYMQKHGSITPLQALDDLGIMRLGARIWDLKRDGHRISAELESGLNRHGEAVRYARYTLMEGNNG